MSNYPVFRECLSGPILLKLAAPVKRPSKRKGTSRTVSVSEEVETIVEDLSEFIDVSIVPLDLNKAFSMQSDLPRSLYFSSTSLTRYTARYPKSYASSPTISSRPTPV